MFLSKIQKYFAFLNMEELCVLFLRNRGTLSYIADTGELCLISQILGTLSYLSDTLVFCLILSDTGTFFYFSDTGTLSYLSDTLVFCLILSDTGTLFYFSDTGNFILFIRHRNFGLLLRGSLSYFLDSQEVFYLRVTFRNLVLPYKLDELILLSTDRR